MKTLLIIYIGISVLTLFTVLAAGAFYEAKFKREHPTLKFKKGTITEKLFNLWRILLACFFPIAHLVILFAVVFKCEDMEEIAIQTCWKLVEHPEDE